MKRRRVTTRKRPTKRRAVMSKGDKRRTSIERWIKRFRGTLKGGPTTDEIMKMTRGY